MTDTFHIDLLTPQEKLLSTEVEMIVIPGTAGEFGVLANHAPMISSVKNGVLRTEGRKEGDQPIFVVNGFVEVTAQGCTILAEKAIELNKVVRKDLEENIEKLKRAITRELPEEEKGKIEGELAIEESLLDAVTQYS